MYNRHNLFLIPPIFLRSFRMIFINLYAFQFSKNIICMSFQECVLYQLKEQLDALEKFKSKLQNLNLSRKGD